MSDTRELREKLEQVQAELRQTKAELDKQRAQHAREQKSLHEDLEATRKEASKLLARIEKAEERERERAVVLPAELEDEEGTSSALDTLVALARVPEPVDQALPTLSRLLRLSPVDVRLRLTASQPSILARLPGLEAEALTEVLIAEGFAAVSAPVSQLVGALTPIRRFTLEEQRLVLEDAKRVSLEVPYSELRLLVRGRRKSVSIETKVEMEHNTRIATMDRFEMRRPREETVKHHRIENFLWVYGGTVRAAFTDATSFISLGAKQGLTKHEAMQNLMAELRQRAPHVLVDERLLGPSLSLPTVGPERSQEVLAGLVDQSIQASLWP
jgi:multidrug efflux pump subunit AcrA (membrane-fusion protein)